MARYSLKISLPAREDLRDLYRDGFLRWGEAQADRYYDDLLAHFDVLCENPMLFREVDEIREGYRRSVCGVHAIYYRVQEDAVEIMAVVKHQDIARRL